MKTSNERPQRESMDRRAAVVRLVATRRDGLIVTGLGSPSYDVYAAGDDDRNYYLWGAMGGAALVGLGLALAQPDRRVMVITGDGEQLMAMGSLATIAVAAPLGLDLFILDNEHYGETGMQISHTKRGVDLAAVAAASGFASTAVFQTLTELETFLASDGACAQAGPRLYVLKIATDSPPRALPPRDAVHIKNRFRANLGFSPN